MNTRQLSQAIAQRLPNCTQEQVADVLDGFAEVVERELMRPDGYIYLRGLGRLHVDHHFLQPSGIFQGRYHKDWTLLRLYFQFTPTRELKKAVRDALDRPEEVSTHAPGT